MRTDLVASSIICTAIVALAVAVPSVGQEVATRAGETYIKAQPLERKAPVYPPRALSEVREGWVAMSFIITKDGAVSEAMIEDSTGNEDLERAALAALEQWRFQPATLDGEPVEQSMTQTIIRFVLEGPGTNGASKEFTTKYAQIQKAINEEDLARADELLSDLQFLERHNLYEEAWFAWLKYTYLTASGSQDQDELEKSLRAALGYEEDFLPADMFVAAAERLYVLYANGADLSAAIETYKRLTSSKTAKRSKRYEPTIANLEQSYQRILDIVQGEQVLAVKGQIGEHDYWVHKLLRRSFSFGEVTGKIEVVDIRCTRANKQYFSFEEGSIWHIPEGWGDCGVYVKGAQGTVFDFYEYSPATARELSQPAVSNE